MALFVLHSIKLIRLDAELHGEGGEMRLHLHWDVDSGALRPTEYEYRLPSPPDENGT
jgi:hypothetical protein